MNSYRLDFRPKALARELDPDFLTEKLTDYFFALVHGGQICPDWELEKLTGALVEAEREKP